MWLVKEKESHQFVSYNTFQKDGSYQLWIERPNGKTMKVREGSKEEIAELKEMFDYAIEHGETTVTI